MGRLSQRALDATVCILKEAREAHVKMEAEVRGIRPHAKQRGSCQQLEEARKDPSLEPPDEAWPCRTLIFNFWPPQL